MKHAHAMRELKLVHFVSVPPQYECQTSKEYSRKEREEKADLLVVILVLLDDDPVHGGAREREIQDAVGAIKLEFDVLPVLEMNQFDVKKHQQRKHGELDQRGSPIHEQREPIHP